MSRFFKTAEFDSPDAPGSGSHMDPAFVEQLDQVRELCGFPLAVVSGYRTDAHNEAIKGAMASWHTKGKAADLRCHDGVKRYHIVRGAIMAGIKGIEICDGHVHLDARPSPWLWPDKSR